MVFHFDRKGVVPLIQIPAWGLTIIFSAISIALAVLSFVYGRLKEGRDRADAKLKEVVEEAKEKTELSSEVKFISRLLDSMNEKMCNQFGDLDGRIRQQEEESSKKRERIAVVEQSCKSSHHRLDDHEQRIQVLEKGG